MNNSSLKTQSLQSSSYERFMKYMPETSTITSFGGGMIIGVVGQPFSNWKRASQHAPKGATKRAIFESIMAPRVITDQITGRIVIHGGGILNFWAALAWGMLGSTVKQGAKGTALVKVDNSNLPGFMKAFFTAGINFCKDFIEVFLIRVIRYYKVQYVKSLGREITAQESAMMAFFTTLCKLIITQPLDGIKADLQQILKTEGKKIGWMDVVRRQGIYKLFTAGLVARFVLNYLSILTSFYAMQFNDYLQKQKVLDKSVE